MKQDIQVGWQIGGLRIGLRPRRDSVEVFVRGPGTDTKASCRCQNYRA